MRPCTRPTGWRPGSLWDAVIATMFVVVLTSAVGAIAAPVIPASVEQPRAFGYVLGDVLTQRVLLKSGGRDVGAVALPSVGRIGIWLERRPARLESDAEGRRWLVIDYQITNAPQTLTEIALPALTLTSESGAVLQVAEWPVSVGPLTSRAAFGKGDLQDLRPDREAPLVQLAPIRRRIGWALGLLAMTLLTWLGWWQWRNQREAARLPFARAWRQMQRLEAPDIDADADAWLCLHRALNETAGQVVHASSLSSLFARAPHLRPLHPQLEHFYRHSAERFFAAAPANSRFPLLDLCRKLYRAEKRQQ
ncbi:mxaA protein [Paraburkholderia sp. GAS448]|uniref:calcium incorporation protein MxaA n=1 Tax=Paraburkholderia sp. GAS448 TaxID=3035136 RepID=UPI003D215ACF